MDGQPMTGLSLQSWFNHGSCGCGLRSVWWRHADAVSGHDLCEYNNAPTAVIHPCHPSILTSAHRCKSPLPSLYILPCIM